MLQDLHGADGALLERRFSYSVGATTGDEREQRLCGFVLEADAAHAQQRQRLCVELAKKQQSLKEQSDELKTSETPCAPERSEAFCALEPDEHQEPFPVPLPLALKGPGAIAWHLAQNANCTEEQHDAVALLALDMQRA